LTRLDIAKPAGLTQARIPPPAFLEPSWLKPAGSNWQTNAKTVRIVRDAKYSAEFLHVVWTEGENAPAVEVKSTFATQSRAVDLSKPLGTRRLSDSERKLNLSPTEFIPTDGIVKETSDRIPGARSDLDKARRIYEWIVETAYRDPKTRGCGLGDVATPLKLGNLGGKCKRESSLPDGVRRLLRGLQALSPEASAMP
jgi:hypothetical protein